MLITEIHIKNIRNLRNVIIEPNKKINYFYGKNAAGKTALLEAIYLLSRAKSFRTPRIREIIRKKEKKLWVSAKLIDQKDNIINVGIEYDQKETRIKYRDKKVKRISKQARNLPLFIFTSDSQKIITGTPKDRRNWLDWGLFHVEHTYIDVWKAYHKALRQRNVLLRKERAIPEIRPWEKEIANYGNQLEQSRKKYITNLQQQIDKGNSINIGNINLEYLGVAGNLLDILETDRAKDRLLGTTQKGPHRTEVKFLINDKDAVNILSRGQIKLYTAIVIMSQVSLFISQKEEKPIILFDDISAELDEENREGLFRSLCALGTQLFINATEKDLLINQCPKQLFHVEQGRIYSMNHDKIKPL